MSQQNLEEGYCLQECIFFSSLSSKWGEGEKNIYRWGNLQILQKFTPYDALTYTVLFQVLPKCYMTLLQARAFMETSLLLGSVKNCCPSNWVHFQSSCYFFSTNTMSWASSLKNCSDMGAHLVVINTREEQVVGVQPPPMSMRPSS